MSLTRKVRKIGESLGVSIPSQLASMLTIQEGDEISWDITDSRTGVLRAQVVKVAK